MNFTPEQIKTIEAATVRQTWTVLCNLFDRHTRFRLFVMLDAGMTADQIMNYGEPLPPTVHEKICKAITWRWEMSKKARNN